MSIPNSAGLLSIDSSVPANSAGAAVQLSGRTYKAATVWLAYSAAAITAGGSLNVKFEGAESESGPWVSLNADVSVSLDGVNAQSVKQELSVLRDSIVPYIRAKNAQALTAGSVTAAVYLQDQ